MKCSKIKINLPEEMILLILSFMDDRKCPIYSNYKNSFLNKVIFASYNKHKEYCYTTENAFFTYCNTHKRMININATEFDFCRAF